MKDINYLSLLRKKIDNLKDLIFIKEKEFILYKGAQNLNAGTKAVKQPEENITKNLCDLWLGKNFLDKT